jgi:hypothetical protein
MKSYIRLRGKRAARARQLQGHRIKDRLRNAIEALVDVLDSLECFSQNALTAR